MTLRQVLEICRAKANWISNQVEELNCPSEVQEQSIDLYMLLADLVDPHGLDMTIIDDTSLRTWMRTIPQMPGELAEAADEAGDDTETAKAAKNG